MVAIGDDLAKHEEWNSVQMVWGMDAYSKSTHGNKGDPVEVLRRAHLALKRRDVAQADARVRGKQCQVNNSRWHCSRRCSTR
jgi:hypothetical protein